MVVANVDLDEPGQTPESVLSGTSADEDLPLKSPVHSRIGGLSPCLQLADDNLIDEQTAEADANLLITEYSDEKIPALKKQVGKISCLSGEPE